MYEKKRQIENTHITRERDRRRFRELLSVVSLVVPVGAFLLLFTWQNLEVIRLGREATRLQEQQGRLENLNRNLRLEIERLTALGTVEEKAVAMGFERTEAARVVLISARKNASIPDKPLQQRGN